MEIEQIKNHLRRALVGEKLRYIVRSCELIDFGFGELFRRKNSRGYEREVASYALHLLCPFRIAMEGRCLTGSEDLYKNASPSNEQSIWEYRIPACLTKNWNGFDICLPRRL